MIRSVFLEAIRCVQARRGSRFDLNHLQHQKHKPSRALLLSQELQQKEMASQLIRAQLPPKAVCCRTFTHRALPKTSIGRSTTFFNTYRPLQRAPNPVQRLLQKRSYIPHDYHTQASARRDRFILGKASVALLIATSVGVFAFAYLPASIFKRPEDIKDFIQRNFVLSGYNLEQGRWWTYITHTFAHGTFFHMAFNMIAFWSFSTRGIMCLGAMGPLICYFVGGITGGLAGTRYEAQKYGSEESSHHGFVGASGGILAFITAVSICDPSTRIGLLFLPWGIPGTLAVTLFAGYSLVAEMTGIGQISNAGNIGHVGSIASGAAIAVLFKMLRR